MTTALALLCGIVIGLALGMLGGGGSILAVPALVYVLGKTAQDAVTASLVVIGISSAIGALSYHRDRQVQWRVGLVFGVVGTGASFAGTALNRHVEEPILLGSFATVMVVSATAMLRGSVRTRRDRRTSRDAGPSGVPLGERTGSTTKSLEPPRIGSMAGVEVKVAVEVVATALAVGFLTGFLGVGGGFIVVPALVLILGYSMPVAAATSLLVIALNAGVSLAIHAGSSPQFDWAVIIPFTTSTIIASLIGKRLASHVSSQALTTGFAVILLLTAAAIGVQVAPPHLGLS